jgi:hypothetical protein
MEGATSGGMLVLSIRAHAACMVRPSTSPPAASYRIELARALKMFYYIYTRSPDMAMMTISKHDDRTRRPS